MNKFLIPTLFLFYTKISIGQHFITGEQHFVSTTQINPSGFSFLSIGNIKRTNLDLVIPFSALQYLINEDGKSYQVVLQKNNEGKIIVMGIDLSLVPIFKCAKKLVYPIDKCIEKKLASDFVKDEEHACISCLIERLNQCF